MHSESSPVCHRMPGSARSAASLTLPRSATACVAGRYARTGTRTVHAWHTLSQSPTSQTPKATMRLMMMASMCPTAQEPFQTPSSCPPIGCLVIYLPHLHQPRAKPRAGCFRVSRRAKKVAKSCWNPAGCAVCAHVTATSSTGARRTCSPASPARANYTSATRHALAAAWSSRKSSRCSWPDSLENGLYIKYTHTKLIQRAPYPNNQIECKKIYI